MEFMGPKRSGIFLNSWCFEVISIGVRSRFQCSHWPCEFLFIYLGELSDLLTVLIELIVSWYGWNKLYAKSTLSELYTKLVSLEDLRRPAQHCASIYL